MIALYRAGRQADALERFREGRAALVEAFGLEPTPALKELETRVLLQDPTLDAPGRARAGAAGRSPHRAARRAGRRGAGRLVAVGRRLAALGRHELLVTQVVDARGAARRRRRRRRAPGATTSAEGASRAGPPPSSRVPSAPTLARLALTHDADVVVVDAPQELARDGVVPDEIALLLERSPCDVALLAGSAPPAFEAGSAVLFGGGDHDWAAAELGAWLAAGAGPRSG